MQACLMLRPKYICLRQNAQIEGPRCARQARQRLANAGLTISSLGEKRKFQLRGPGITATISHARRCHVMPDPNSKRECARGVHSTK